MDIASKYLVSATTILRLVVFWTMWSGFLPSSHRFSQRFQAFRAASPTSPCPRIASGCRAENRAWSWTKQQGCRWDKVLITLLCPGARGGRCGKWFSKSGKWMEMGQDGILKDILSSTFNHFHWKKQIDFWNSDFEHTLLHQILVIFILRLANNCTFMIFPLVSSIPRDNTQKESSSKR